MLNALNELLFLLIGKYWKISDQSFKKAEEKRKNLNNFLEGLLKCGK